MAKRKKSRGTGSVHVKGYTYTRKGHRVHVPGYRRRKPR